MIGLLLAATFAERSMRSPSAPVPDRVHGQVRLIDGDSFRLNGDEVRLQGIDAPEGRQMCVRNGKDWACGEASRQALSRLIAGRPVSCDVKRRDQHGRLLGYCRAGATALNSAMVEAGFAVGFGEFERQERVARDARRGVWGSEFERPQEWRRKNLGGTG